MDIFMDGRHIVPSSVKPRKIQLRELIAERLRHNSFSLLGMEQVTEMFAVHVFVKQNSEEEGK